MSRVVLIVIAMLLWNAPARAQSVEANSTSRPSSQPADDSKISGLISQLNDPDPDVREQATKALWSLGRSIIPKLRVAAAGGPPEVARRARSILRDFMYGLYPDTPKEIFNLLDQYRTGDLGQKQTAIWMLNSRGIAGLRVLLKLQDDERDEELKKMIARVLEPRAHDVAVMLIAEGETSAAAQNLESAAQSASVTSSAAQDYAAFLATTGKLAAKRQLLEAEPLSARNAVLRFSLARAARDLPAAKAAAEKITDPEYLDSILVEQGEWAELARRLEKTPRMEPAERLGFLCTYYRLAGDDQSFRKTVDLIIKRAQTAPQEYVFCSENLFLNSLPKEGEQILLDHKDFLLASCYLGPRLELQKALELPELAQKGQPTEETKVRLRTVDALHFAGENEKALQALASAAGENRLRNDPAVWTLLIESAMQMGRQEIADQYMVEILTKATNQDPLAPIFKKIHLDDGQAASQWWRFLRHEHPADPVAQSFKDLRSLYAKTNRPDELAKLSTAAEKYLAELQPVERESWQEAVGDIMEKNGQMDLARQWFTKLASSTGNPRALIRVGDFEADRHNWTSAAQSYESAWERDYTRASALYLRGWALTQSGHSDEGRAMMEDADRIPLGSELARRDLMEAMQRHNLKDAVRHEIDLVLTLTALRSYERNETLRDAAELAAAKLDYAGAVNLWERAFLSNLTNDIRFEEPWANVVVPALIHRVRALGMIQSGKIDSAVKEARLTLELTPADADALIDFVNALDKSKRKDRADALYREQTDYYRKLTTDYPRSGPAHNQLAWSQVMCHRDLDDALVNAKKAVDLEPTSTASLDTLAEVYFAKGDAKSAAEQMQKCVDLEPTVARHRQQLTRFQNALSAATQPAQ